MVRVLYVKGDAMNNPEKKVRKLDLYGYTKEEDGRFVSICVNLSLFAQGKSQDESMKKLFKNIKAYLKGITEKYADDWVEHAERDTAPEIVEEFKLLLESSLHLAERAVENVRDKDYSRYTGVYSTFVKPISSSYAQAGS